MKILIVTDAWRPQVNGVVRTLERLALELRKGGVEVEFLTPLDFRTIPCPTYPEIRLALTRRATVARRIAAFAPDYVHIATEGPLGLMAAKVALAHHGGYTTSYHTRFPEYLSARLPVPERWTYAWLRRFHNAGHGCMVATETLRRDLTARGFRNLLTWSRGVDTDLFQPSDERVLDLPRPIFLNVGRVAVEKNLEAFLELDLPGSKVVVGDGPRRAALAEKYPDAHFLGPIDNEHLAKVYASADVFVFPSRTDTFGNVLIEALACGVPVAAFPVMGPLDIIEGSGAGVLSEDLREAALRALEIPRGAAIAHSRQYTWERSAGQFLDNVQNAVRLKQGTAAGESDRLAAE